MAFRKSKDVQIVRIKDSLAFLKAIKSDGLRFGLEVTFGGGSKR